LDGTAAHSKRAGGLFDRQIRDEPQADDLRHARMLDSQLLQRPVETGEECLARVIALAGSGLDASDLFVRDPSAALFGSAPPRVIDQMALHLHRHQLEERCLGGEIHRLVSTDAHVGLVNERRGLQCMSSALSPHHPSGDAAKLPVHGFDHLIGSVWITGPPLLKELTDLARLERHRVLLVGAAGRASRGLALWYTPWLAATFPRQP